LTIKTLEKRLLSFVLLKDQINHRVSLIRNFFVRTIQIVLTLGFIFFRKYFMYYGTYRHDLFYALKLFWIKLRKNVFRIRALFVCQKRTKRIAKCKFGNLFENHFDFCSSQIVFDPIVPFLELVSCEVVFPIPDLTFAEEVCHHLLHVLVAVRHRLRPVLPHVADVQVVVESQNLKRNLVLNYVM